MIGINTAIVAAGQGIGFAIPINEAKCVMGQLIARGKVMRGWLGIVIQDVTDELAASFGVRESEGVLVADVMKGGPGEAAGLQARRRHRELGGTKIREVPDLQRRVANVAPGQTIAPRVIRDRAPSKPQRAASARCRPTTPRSPPWRPGPRASGCRSEPLAPDTAERLGLPFTHGLLVTDVATGGPGRPRGPAARRRHPGSRPPARPGRPRRCRRR